MQPVMVRKICEALTEGTTHGVFSIKSDQQVLWPPAEESAEKNLNVTLSAAKEAAKVYFEADVVKTAIGLFIVVASLIIILLCNKLIQHSHKPQ